MPPIEVIVRCLRGSARIPARATAGSAGYDLFSDIQQPVLIQPGKIAIIPTGIAIALPQGCAALIFGRSGLGIRHGIVPANAVGVIDSDYRGEIMVGLRNQSSDPYTVNPGERVAQLVLINALQAQWRQEPTLEQSQRAEGGFGSTGR